MEINTQSASLHSLVAVESSMQQMCSAAQCISSKYVCMYVINIYLVSAPLRVFSGALKGCSESVPNNMEQFTVWHDW